MKNLIKNHKIKAYAFYCLNSGGLSKKGNFSFLAGGTDINIQLKNGTLTSQNIIFINHLPEFHGISENNESIIIGTSTTFSEIIESPIISEYLPFFRNSLKSFASPLIQTTATIGGNIANASPTGDSLPLLLVLDAKLELVSRNNTRIIPLSDFYNGYKKMNLRSNEIIKSVLIPKIAEKDYKTFYRKIGSRKSLSIAKLSVAGLKKIKDNRITEIKIAAGALHEYPRRLTSLENIISGKLINEIGINDIVSLLQSEITPISDLRSDKEYRFEVCLNLIKSFIFDF